MSNTLTREITKDQYEFLLELGLIRQIETKREAPAAIRMATIKGRSRSYVFYDIRAGEKHA